MPQGHIVLLECMQVRRAAELNSPHMCATMCIIINHKRSIYDVVGEMLAALRDIVVNTMYHGTHYSKSKQNIILLHACTIYAAVER